MIRERIDFLWYSAVLLWFAQFSSNAVVTPVSLQWRHNERDGVSNHWRLDCLLSRLFSCGSKKTSKLRVTGSLAFVRGIHRSPDDSPHKGLSARWATELLWQPPEEYICEIVEMFCVWNVSYCILLEIKLLLRASNLENVPFDDAIMIALPRGWAIGCLLWIQSLIYACGIVLY